MKRSFKYLLDLAEGKTVVGAKRSPHWPTTRNWFVKNVQPFCQLCLGTKNLEVHHIVPFHMAPERELDTSNLITLCEDKKLGISSCHQLFGHLGNYQLANPDVIKDVLEWRKKLLNGKLEELFQKKLLEHTNESLFSIFNTFHDWMYRQRRPVESRRAEAGDETRWL